MAKTTTKKAGKRAAAAASESVRICAARPNGPYGIDAKKPCTNPTRRPTAALCAEHEPMWRAEARRRAAASKGAAAASAPKKARAAKQPAATSPEDLEAELEASVAATKKTRKVFASPALERKAKAKRAASKRR